LVSELEQQWEHFETLVGVWVIWWVVWLVPWLVCVSAAELHVVLVSLWDEASPQEQEWVLNDGNARTWQSCVPPDPVRTDPYNCLEHTT